MGTGPICEGTVNESSSVLSNRQNKLAVDLMQNVHSPFEHYIFWLCWMMEGFSEGSRVHPRVAVHPNGLLCPGVDSPPYATLWTNCGLMHFKIALIFMKQPLSCQWKRALILKTERLRSIQRLRGSWGPRWGHTQDRAGLQIPPAVTTGEQVSQCFLEKYKSRKGKPLGHVQLESAAQQESKTTAFVNNLLHNVDGRLILRVWLILWLDVCLASAWCFQHTPL